MLRGEEVGVTVGDVDAFMSHAGGNCHGTEAHVDQQRYMPVTDIMHANSFDPGRTAAPIHFVIEIILCDRKDAILLHPIEGLDVFLHFLTEEFGHLDRANVLLCLRCSDHVLSVEPLVGFVDGYSSGFEVEVSGRQRQQLALADSAPVEHLKSVVGHRFTDSNLNHTGIYLYSKGKIMIHLTFDYKTDEKCITPGQYLKYHRTFQGLSTRELAEKVGIVPATLVLYENDRHPIKYSTAVALANVLGIDRNRLLDEYTAFVDYPYSSLLKMVRQELSLTQMQMAEVIGIGQTSYSGWEREIRVPRRKEYEKILAALKKLKVNVDTYLCHPAST